MKTTTRQIDISENNTGTNQLFARAFCSGSNIFAIGIAASVATSVDSVCASTAKITEFSTDSSTLSIGATIDSNRETSSESAKPCLPTKPNELVAAVLNYHSLSPTRISTMPEGSDLFEFIDTFNGCVEVYPTGEIVVVIKEGPIRDLYELTTSEVNLIVPILKDAMRPRVL